MDYLVWMIKRMLKAKPINFYQLKKKLAELGAHLDKQVLVNRIKRLRKEWT